MRTLITKLVLSRFADNYSEEEYQTGWNKLQQYVDAKDTISTIKEKELQTEFMKAIFENILGYAGRSTNMKNPNYIVEMSLKGKFVDGALLQDGKVKAMIELKSIKSNDLFKSSNGSGFHGLAPIHQGALYHFMMSSSELGIVSNYDTIIIFNNKEDFRQEFSLFNMDYETFKEFYLILCKQSFFGGLTNLMIEQSLVSEKDMDYDFFILANSIYKSLHNKFKPEYASDLFNKFIAMAIFEDSSKLPPMLIKTVYNRKTDFAQNLKSHWEVFKAFFLTMKNNKAGRDQLGINDAIAGLDIWQDVSYFGKISVSKSILDQVVSLSEYNLKSMPIDRFFYTMTKMFNHQYSGIAISNDELEDDEEYLRFQFYSKYFNDVNPQDVCLAFVTKTFDDLDNPLVKLFNQISETKITKPLVDAKKFAISTDYESNDSWFTIIDKEDLDHEWVITENLETLVSVEIKKIDNNDYVLLNYGKPSDQVNILMNGQIVNTINKSNIKKRLVILTAEEQEWIENYETVSQPLSKYIDISSEDNSSYCFDIEALKIAEKDEFSNWSKDFYWTSANAKTYYNILNPDINIILLSPDFLKYVYLKDLETIDGSLLISDNLFSESVLKPLKDLRDIQEKIELYTSKIARLQKTDGSETEILKYEMQLEKLIEKETELKG